MKHTITDVVNRALLGSPFHGTVSDERTCSTTVYHVTIEDDRAEYSFEILPFEPYRISANGDLWVEPEYRERGIAPILVGLRERIARELSMDAILIGENGNDGFWKHFGYQELSETDLERYREIRCPVGAVYFSETSKLFAAPRHKILNR